ncbi:MAG: hypothetical protein IJR39_05595 [Treponema sp.]|nr:hypothetical protein [Treponema sp.]
MHALNLPILFSAVVLFVSCVTTKEYVETKKQFYENDMLVTEEFSRTENGLVVENSSKSFSDFAEKFQVVSSDSSKSLVYAFTSKKEKKNGIPYEEVDFSLVEYHTNLKKNEIKTTIIGTRKMRMQNGTFIYFKDSSGKMVRETGDRFPPEFEAALKEIIADFSKKDADSEIENDGKKDSSESLVVSKKITVTSTPNKSYIFYQFAGKPFVIAGATAWNLIKCAGYACINFIGGYNAANGNIDGTIWMIPSWSKSKEKAELAKEENKVQVYPEYHIPFTNNHIVVEKYNQDISVVALSQENSEIITPVERHEYDNSMSVERSAKADAASTAAFAGLIGTAVTIPVSAVSWVGGAAAGIYAQTVNK